MNEVLSMNPSTGKASVAQRVDVALPREQRGLGSLRGVPLEAHRGGEEALRVL